MRKVIIDGVNEIIFKTKKDFISYQKSVIEAINETGYNDEKITLKDLTCVDFDFEYVDDSEVERLLQMGFILN
jgi:hypothetical protein